MSNLFGHSVKYEGGRKLDQSSTTVIIPLYNQGNYVEETLDSVMWQTKENIDLVVVNDASSDDSLSVVKNWMELNHARFNKCLLLENNENYGLSQTRNNAINNSSTEYVFCLDSDNMIYPKAIEKLEGVLERTGSAAAYTQLEFFGDEKTVGHAWAWEKEKLAFGNYIDALALIRRSVCIELGGFTQLEGTGWEDYDFWCKLADVKMEAVFIPEILCRYRVSAGSMLRTETLRETDMIALHIAFRYPWMLGL